MSKQIELFQAIRKYVYWTYNFSNPKQMIIDVWGNGCLGAHFLSKLEECGYNMHRFFIELSLDNQEKLIAWVLENYHGV